MIGSASSLTQKRSLNIKCVAQPHPKVGPVQQSRPVAHAQVTSRTRYNYSSSLALGKRSALPVHARRVGRSRYGARKVETKALMPMYGTACAVGVALQASKAKLPVLMMMGKASAPPFALLAGAVLAVISSHLISKGLKPDEDEEEFNQEIQEMNAQAQWNWDANNTRFSS